MQYKLNYINTCSSFTAQIPRTRLVKINQVCFCNLATSLLSAVLTITHGKRALLIQNGYKFCKNR